MVVRKIAAVLRQRLGDYPAVALIGPRQSGKTTLAKFFGGTYFDLEDPGDRLQADLRWNSLMTGAELVLLDEAQAAPDIFPKLRGAIDADRQRNGRFLLLGSVSPGLMKHVSESLAGRLSLVELTPFLVDELADAPVEQLWRCGGYPEGGILQAARYPQWQRDYLALLAQRDLPTWGLPAGPQLIERLLHMLAAVHGALWNASQIGKSLGLSYHTVNGYLDYLEGAFLIRRLPPYASNIRKRLVKSPKLYWRDPGLLHALLNVVDADHLLRQPWVGASWEGFIIEQVLGVLAHLGRVFSPFFLRTADGKEIDLVLDFGTELWAVEAKLTASPSLGDLDQLDRAADLIRADKRILISQTSRPASDGRRVSCDLPWFVQWLAGG